MKLVKNTDPLEELQELLEIAKSLPKGKVKHIELSRAEMKAVVTHVDAVKVIPDYLLPQLSRLQRCRDRIKALANNQRMDDRKIPQQKFFDTMDKLEEEEAQITSVVPKQFTQSGILICSSIL